MSLDEAAPRRLDHIGRVGLPRHEQDVDAENEDPEWEEDPDPLSDVDREHEQHRDDGAAQRQPSWSRARSPEQRRGSGQEDTRHLERSLDQLPADVARRYPPI